MRLGARGFARRCGGCGTADRETARRVTDWKRGRRCCRVLLTEFDVAIMATGEQGTLTGHASYQRGEQHQLGIRAVAGKTPWKCTVMDETTFMSAEPGRGWGFRGT